MTRRDIAFDAEGVTLRGWFYPAQNTSGRCPTVVMAHGFSAVKEMYLDAFAEVFAAAGLNEINRPPKHRAATAPSPYRRSDDHLTTRHQAECDRDVGPTTNRQPSRTGTEPARTAQRAWSRP
jgi:fermentation-respiration switch protein FrsA (DUF1100 family)